MASPAERIFEGRHVDPAAISVEVGFRIEAAAKGLSSPLCVAFDELGDPYVAEMGSMRGSAYSSGRVVRIRDDGTAEPVIEDFTGSLTGLTYYEGAFFAAEHGHSSRIWRIFPDGDRQLLVEGLPGGGDHPTSSLVVSNNRFIYFGQGTRTNSGVVGLDNRWASGHPELCDIPGVDTVLAGRNYSTPDLFGPGEVLTGAFKVYGVACEEGEIIPGDDLCSGGILRIDPDGGERQLFAWGFRRPLGMSVHADGRIFCTDIGIEDRGSRGVADGRSYVWQAVEGGWYGWPDYTGGRPVTELGAEFVMEEHPPLAGKPVAELPAKMGIAGLDFSRSLIFGPDDIAFLALMGQKGTANGVKIISLDINTGEITDFALNRHPGPASDYRSGGLERPVDVKFDRTGEIMYILDCGIIDETDSAVEETGVLWRVVPEFYSRTAE